MEREGTDWGLLWLVSSVDSDWQKTSKSRILGGKLSTFTAQ